MRILGVRVDEINKREALQKVALFLSVVGQKTIFTPNPEILVKAQKDPYFKEVLNRGDLNICDGRGIQLVSSQKIERIPGVDFMLEICELAEKNDKSIFLLGSGSDDVIKKTAEKIQSQFPKLKIAGYDKGPVIHENIKTLKHKNNVIMQQYNSDFLLVNPVEQNALLNKINLAKSDILFVALGMGKQEKWIDDNLAKLPSVKIAMGVGGSFDYISGKTKRAPCWVQKIGLEWLYRLGQEPTRILRILNATVAFLLYILIKK